MAKEVGATEFKAKCLRIINQMNVDGELVTITNRGRPVAVLSPVRKQGVPSSIVGAMVGTVLRYDEPFQPATSPSDWNAAR